MKRELISLLIFVLAGLTTIAQQNISDSLQHQNYQRQYIVHLPPGYNSSGLGQ